MPNAVATPETEAPKRHGNMPLNMVTSYVFFQLDPEFRKLPATQKQQARQELEAVFAAKPDSLWIRYYSTFGLREDADFFMWSIDKTLEPWHELMGEIYKTSFGPYLKQSYNYLAVSKESDYEAVHNHEQVPADENAPYLFVYPFIKTREWYQLPLEQRMTMMKEHIDVGHQFPGITINTAYSFGIDDQDFVVSFDGNTLEEFVKLVMKLRETEASKYTANDKPMFVGLKKPSIGQVLDTLGI